MKKDHYQLHHFHLYTKFLDKTNALILRQLAIYGPRNITSLAKATNLPLTTVRFRLKNMMDKGLLRIFLNANMSRLGLARAFLTVDSILGNHEKLRQIIKSVDYWTYIVRCYGRMDGYCAYFAFPADKAKELEEYFDHARSLGLSRQHRFLWITNSYYVTPDFDWYDFEKRKWNLRWDEWVQDILNARDELPIAMREPESYEIMVDKPDILIIKELEKNATVDLKDLSDILNITPQSIGHRFKKHVLDRKLIVNYDVDIYPFPLENSEKHNFIIEFKNQSSLSKFVNASDRKPFVVSYSKVIGKEALVANFYVPKSQFPMLIQSLHKLFSKGLVQDFSYVTWDFEDFEHQTVSYEYFEDRKWTYDREEKNRFLQNIARQ